MCVFKTEIIFNMDKIIVNSEKSYFSSAFFHLISTFTLLAATSFRTQDELNYWIDFPVR